MPKPEKAERLDRHSGTGNRGLAKKEGHAGKFGWGKAGTGEDGEAILDPNDPNYVSDEDNANVVLRKTEVDPSQALVNEYLASGDLDETAKSLKEHNVPHLHSHFVKKALLISAEKSAYDRELISVLLASASFFGRVLSFDQIEEGFQQALDSLDDAALDIPDAVDIISKFLARAVVDEIVPPVFLTNAASSSPQAKEALRRATALATESHRGERLAHIWGAGDMKSVKRLKKEVGLILEEYLINGDADEAEKCVRNLNAPSFFFQLVRQALRLVLVKNDDATKKKISSLLARWYKSGFLSRDHIKKGFSCMYENLNDIKLDVPQAESLLVELTEFAKKEGWLENDFVPPQKKE